MMDATLLAIEAELQQIKRDLESGSLTKSEAQELLRDIDLAKTVATTAEALEKKTQVQALLDATVTVVSAMA